MSNNTQKIRVLWHEIGHFVAACFNQKHFSGFGTESITIIHAGHDYQGLHTPIKPENYVEGSPIRNPAALIASYAYGCIFQTIFQKIPFNTCFSFKPRHNGLDDFQDVSSVLASINIFPPTNGRIYDLIDEYYQQINNNQEFKDLFQYNLTSYIDTNQPVITIDLTSVRTMVDDFINESGSGVCILEYEFGIFGDNSGASVLFLLEKLRVPLLLLRLLHGS